MSSLCCHPAREEGLLPVDSPLKGSPYCEEEAASGINKPMVEQENCSTESEERVAYLCHCAKDPMPNIRYRTRKPVSVWDMIERPGSHMTLTVDSSTRQHRSRKPHRMGGDVWYGKGGK